MEAPSVLAWQTALHSIQWILSNPLTPLQQVTPAEPFTHCSHTVAVATQIKSGHKIMSKLPCENTVSRRVSWEFLFSISQRNLVSLDTYVESWISVGWYWNKSVKVCKQLIRAGEIENKQVRWSLEQVRRAGTAAERPGRLLTKLTFYQSLSGTTCSCMYVVISQHCSSTKLKSINWLFLLKKMLEKNLKILGNDWRMLRRCMVWLE